MSDKAFYLALIYFLAVSACASLLTVIDKIKAQKGKWRIPENTLMLFGFLGGALFEYLTMKTIRHKTLHKKFMLGLPVIILLHIALIILYAYKMTAR